MIKILVAEDEEKSRAATVSRLRGIMGDEALIETAADGNDAVQMALKMRPALIFMDIEMPRKTGLEAAAILHEQLPDTHIVFLTAYDRFDYAVGALRTGGREYLLKPVSETTLRETLRKFFHVEHEPEKDASPFETSLRVWIAQHYTEDITLDDAAESMGMSTFYFSRQVKVLTGHTFLEYLTAYCSATSFLRNWDSILEKKRANLRSISEPARLRQPPPRSTGAAHARGRAQSIREERRIAAPPVLFALLWVRLLPALYGPFCGPLRPFGGCPWGVTPPARECLPPAPPDTRRRG